jgi:ribosomal protein S27AE
VKALSKSYAKKMERLREKRGESPDPQPKERKKSVNTSTLKRTQVLCPKCGWIKSPIQAPPGTVLINNTVQCGRCRNMILLDNKTTRWV